MSHGRLTLLIAIYTNDGGTDGAIGIEADGLARETLLTDQRNFSFSSWGSTTAAKQFTIHNFYIKKQTNRKYSSLHRWLRRGKKGLDFGGIIWNSLLSIDAFDRDAIELYTSHKI